VGWKENPIGELEGVALQLLRGKAKNNLLGGHIGKKKPETNFGGKRISEMVVRKVRHAGKHQNALQTASIHRVKKKKRKSQKTLWRRDSGCTGGRKPKKGGYKQKRKKEALGGRRGQR